MYIDIFLTNMFKKGILRDRFSKHYKDIPFKYRCEYLLMLTDYNISLWIGLYKIIRIKHCGCNKKYYIDWNDTTNSFYSFINNNYDYFILFKILLKITGKNYIGDFYDFI